MYRKAAQKLFVPIIDVRVQAQLLYMMVMMITMMIKEVKQTSIPGGP